MTIGTRITNIRGSLSRKAFAKRVGIVENTLRNYEAGLSLPNSDVIAAISGEFSVCVQWLVTGTGPMRPGDADEPTHQGTPPIELLARIKELEDLLAQRDAELSTLKNETLAAYRMLVITMRRGAHKVSDEEILEGIKSDVMYKKISKRDEHE